MGEVYRAKDTRLGREVAMKVLPGDFLESEDGKARFEREARALAALNHPNIAAIYSFEEISGRLLLVQELLEGGTLRETLGKGPLPLKKALDVGLKVAEGLAAAHGKGIVHRDVKPENIFLTKDGHAKLLDFGLARHDVTRHDPSDTRSPTLAAVSEKGVVLGTVAYMSPEQARGETVDFRSDQFSLGTVLYEMLTGKRPFVRDSAAETMVAIIREEPEPLSKLDPKLPALVSWIVQRCLSKDREERYSSTKDLAKELQNLRVHLSEAVSTADVSLAGVPRLRRRVPFWALAAVAALTAVIGLLLGNRFLRSGSPLASPISLSLSFPIDAPPRFSADFHSLALSPDGKTLVYVGSRLFVRSLDREEIKSIAGSEGGVSPFFSPDGLWVGFFSEGKLKKVSLAGGSPIILCDAPTYGSHGSWGADGTIVFAPSAMSGLYRIPASGGESQALTKVDASSSEVHEFAEILPDGEHVLFQIGSVAPNAVPRAAVVSLRTGERRAVAENAANPRFLQTGHLVFTRSGSLLAVPFSLKRLEVSGLAVPVLDDLVTNRIFTNSAQMALSSHGTLVYRSRGRLQRSLVWVDRKGTVETVPFPPRDYKEVALSADGGRIAAIVFEEAETTALLIGELARGTLTRSPVEGILRGPAWAPEGKRIALGISTSAFYPEKVHWLSADGSTPPELATMGTQNNLQELPSSVSPDGSVVIFTGILHDPRGLLDIKQHIYVLPLSGERTSRPFFQTKFMEGAAQFSPDGRWVAYFSNESGHGEVFVRPFPGPRWQISTEGGYGPRWSKSGRELFYRNGDKMMAADVETKPTFRPGRPRTLFEGRFRGSYDVAPDGTRFLMIKPDPAESGPAHVKVVLNWFEEVKRRVPGAK